MSKKWVEDSISPHSRFAPALDIEGEHRYGYGWHSHDLHLGERVYLDYGAGGNGGQIEPAARAG